MLPSHPESLEPVPRFSEFLRSRHREIMEAWLGRVRVLSPARKMPELALLDHLPELLRRVVAIMESGPNGSPADLESMPEAHALDRLGHGFDLNDVVGEYSLLRHCILDLWVEESGDFVSVTELRQLDLAIEHSIAQSIAEYATARERLLRAVDRIADAATGTADVATFLHHLLRVTVETSSAVDTVAVLLREGELLRVRAATGLERELEIGFTLKIGEGFAGRIAAEKQAISLSAASSDPLLKSPLLRERGIKALYGVPLLHNGTLVGVTHIGSTTAREFSEEDKLLFRTMANRATAVIVQAELAERERKAHRDLQEAHARLVEIAKSEHDARRDMQQALALVDSLLAASPVGIAFLDRDLRYVRINEALAAYNGRPVAQHLGRTVREVLAEGADFAEPLLRRVLETGQALMNIEYSTQGSSPHAPSRWFLTNLFPVRLPTGDMLGVGGVILDITDRRRSEEAMREAQRRAEETTSLLDTLLAQAPAGFAFLDRDLRYVRINPALAQMHGRDVEKHLGRKIDEVLPAETLKEVEPRLRQVLSSGEALVGQVISGELSLSTHQRRHLLVSYYPVPGPEGAPLGIGTIATDITERTRAEERQRFLAEAGRQLGLSLNYEHVLEAITRIAAPSLGTSCFVYEVADGHLRWVAAAPAFPGPTTKDGGRRLDVPGELEEVIRGGVPRSYRPIPPPLLPLVGNVLLHSSNAGELRSSALLLVPLHAREKPLALLAIGRPVDGATPAWDEELVEEFARRAAMALDNARLYGEAHRATAMRDQVLAVVSHDLKNPIAVIHLNAEMLGRTKNAELGKKQLHTIERALERLDHLIADLVDTASIQSGKLAVEPAPCRAQDLISEAIQLHDAMASERGIKLSVGPPLAEVSVQSDRRRIQQVFANLIGNALKFSPRDSTIVVSARVADDEVVFSVADQGSGIAPDEIPRIFDPYWSGRRHGQRSTGLGLFISKEIMAAHGGRLWAESRLGHGSVFSFALPVASRDA